MTLLNPRVTVEAEVEDQLVGRLKTARFRERLRIWLWRSLIVVVWLASWQWYGSLDEDNTFFVSKPSLVLQRLFEWFTKTTSAGSIWQQIYVTLSEAVLGFIAGSLLGIILGVILGRSAYLAEILAPFIKAVNAVPRIVLASLFIIWFGLGIESKVATVIVLVFFAVFFNAFTGAREVDGNVIDNAQILGASRWKIMTTIVIPSATTWILSSLHTAFGFALIGAIVGEYAGASKGLGLLISDAQGTFDTAGIFAAMIIITVIALFAEWIFTELENHLLKWRPSNASKESPGL